MASKRQILDLLEHSLKMLKAAGAEFATAGYSESSSINVGTRDGHITDLATTPSGTQITLTARIGDKAGSVSPDTKRPDLLEEAARAAVAATRLKTDNPDQRRPDPALLSKTRHNRSLSLYDPTKPTVESLIANLREAESAAAAVSKKLNGEGASAQWHKERSISLNTAGEMFESQKSSSWHGVSMIAQDGDSKANGSEYSSARHRADLRDPALIGRLAAEEALAGLNARRATPGKFPVVFDPDMAAGLLSAFSKAAGGGSIMMKQSFLNKDSLGQQVFAKGITITDDPHKQRGFGSTMYSGSGLPTSPATIVDNGVLTSLFLGLESARRLGFPIKGTIDGPHNMVITPGAVSKQKLLEDITDGLYVTSLMGHGTDITSGNYSRGASGFWIKNGVLAYPVEEATIAGNLRDMFMNMVAANDLDSSERKIAAPTLRIEGMTIA